MTPPEGAAGQGEAGRGGRLAATRPRVVMLVANGVAGDSRVQKVAWSMAAAGWAVTLLGRAPADEFERYRLGAADVVLVPVPKPVSGYERARRRGGAAAAKLRPAYREARAVLSARDAATGGGARSRVAARLRGLLAAHPGADGLVARCGRGPVGGAARQSAAAAFGAADRHGGWRSFNPWFADLELALAPTVRALEPDLIHAHDFHMVGIGARLAAELSTPQRRVRWIYDAHEYLRGRDVPSRWDIRARMRRRMLVGVEREYIGRADAVVTVSDGIADRLVRDHGLGARPRVVLNAPVVDTRDRGPEGPGCPAPARDLRADCGLGPDVPLLVYSGGMSPRRGVATAIEALAGLAGVHLALIAREQDPDIPALIQRARERAVADRVHVVPYVPVDRVVPYISGATVGLVPILRLPNHELSLITKYFEYLHAALPIVTSDVREMAAQTRRLGVGEVFRAGDPDGLAQAVRRVLADLDRYRAVYQGPNDPRPGSSWQGQASRLDALYREVLGLRPGPPRAAGELMLLPDRPERAGKPGQGDQPGQAGQLSQPAAAEPVSAPPAQVR
ncbi:glycosyltransferase [Actinocrinis puniceicyclus]|uniref:Glycosyltransferase n=1 Tax=Actinocrinis puniceicyclus TaxID=977794 RepID=A0A8J7WTU3_9ACTN|nr:glycosyltransferase [Actinocrinis puniceicyclus]MBS2966044.1 glycosyltransferase [Actinocrinis puniceicyclus]